MQDFVQNAKFKTKHKKVFSNDIFQKRKQFVLLKDIIHPKSQQKMAFVDF